MQNLQNFVAKVPDTVTVTVTVGLEYANGKHHKFLQYQPTKLN
jgi:hypothetical protein